MNLPGMPPLVIKPMRPLVWLALSAIGTLIATAPLWAQETEAPADTPSDQADIDPENLPAAELDGAMEGAAGDLETIENQIALNDERIEQIRAEIEALDGDATQLGAELAAAARRIDVAGEDVRVIEERLEELFASERGIRARLDGHDRSISNLLASLQRISSQPPPAMIVDPQDAVASARAAMLLSSVLPQLQEKAQTVTNDLNALLALKQNALSESEQLTANLMTLHEERLRIATIIEARKQGLEWLSEDLLVEEAEARALSDRAISLEQLISGLETRIAAVTAADEAMRAANAGENISALDAETLRLAFADTSRTEPAVPIEAAKGYLTQPVSGSVLTTYGAADGFGGLSKGMTFAAAAGAEVLAPADGTVAYAGLFLNYGQIVILNAGQDYLVVLSGLEDVSVSRGDFVQMGSPIGTMGEGISLPTQGSGDAAALYIELREGGIPIDPQGWWAARAEQQESGTS